MSLAMLPTIRDTAREPVPNGSSSGPRERIDPRVLVLGTVALAIVIVALRHPGSLAVAAILVAATGLTMGWWDRRTPRRVALLNLFLIGLFPLVAVEIDAWAAWRLPADRIRFFVLLVVRANALLLLAQWLAGGLDMLTLGVALVRLGCPAKLANLMVLTARYLDGLADQYRVAMRAARLRGWVPRADGRTCRALGVLLGSLLLNSLDRSDRILRAMRCRGWQGRFYSLRVFRLTRADAVFTTMVIVVAGLLLAWEAIV